MVNPKVSIIIPIYNTEKYLNFCLDSVAKQTYRNWEAILVDDGSTDSCASICMEYVNSDIRFKYKYQSNAGLSAARNTGIELSTGDYIFFLDSDDILGNKAIENLVSATVVYSADLVLGQTRQFWSGCDVIDDYELECKHSLISSKEAVLGLFGDQHLIYGPAWGKLYRRSIFDSIRFPVGRVYEDIVPITKIYFELKPRIVCVDNAIYYYRQREGSIVSTKNAKHTFDSLYASKSRTQLLKRDKELYKKSYTFHLRYAMAGYYSKTNTPEMKSIYLKSFDEVFFKVILEGLDVDLLKECLKFRIKVLLKK